MESFNLLIIILVIIFSILCLFLMKYLKKGKNTAIVEPNSIRVIKENEMYEIKDNESILEIKPYHQSMIDEYKPTQRFIRLTDTLKEQVGNLIKLTPNTKDLIKTENL